MVGLCDNIGDNEEIVSECKTCDRILRRYDGKIICVCHRYPSTKWWFEQKCPQATFIKHKPDEDPIKEP